MSALKCLSPSRHLAVTCGCVGWVCGGVLQDQLRWIVAQKNRVRNGELYRFIADSRGAFVQVGMPLPDTSPRAQAAAGGSNA